MMNVSVAGPPLLTTQKYFPTRTSPSTLSLFHVFGQLYQIRAYGCSTRDIAEALVPWPGFRHTVHGIVFGQLSQFLQFCRVWSGPHRIIRTLFFSLMKPGKNSCPGSSPHEEHDVKASDSDVHVQHKIRMILKPTN